jgi:hypothetical protein
MDERHRRLHRYVNGLPPAEGRRLGLLVPARGFFPLYATGLAAGYDSAETTAPAAGGVVVDRPPYSGGNPHVRAMAEYLRRHCREDLLGAWVHGSLGSGEETGYSDFDGLAILRTEACRDAARLAAAAGRLYRSLRFMSAADPLQHHGWFVAAEEQTAAWPEHYLPTAALARAASLLPAGERPVTLRPVFRKDRAAANLVRCARSVVGDYNNGSPLLNLYHCKAAFSRFMLLPALYVQAREGRGVDKKESFALAREDFPDALWGVMDEVSAYREEWGPVVMPGLPATAARFSPVLARRLARRLAPPVPENLFSWLLTGGLRRMQALAWEFLQRSAP